MNYQMDYFYGHEANQFTFFRIPKLLFLDERFIGLSSDAKILYGLMLDRMGLSVKNGWIDEKNHVYIYFTLEEVMEYMRIGKDKGVKLFAELDDEKGCGLIKKKKQGLGKPTLIYVMNFVSNIECPENNDFDPSDNDESEFYETTEVKTSENAEVKTSEKPKSGLPEIQNSALLENRSPNFVITEVNNNDFNNNKNNNTDFSDNNTLTKKYNVPLIIDDRVDVALAIDAEGVHVGQSDMPVSIARKLMGDDKIVGATTKTVEQAVEAYAQGADYLGVGAIYPTTTKVKTVLTSTETLGNICSAVPIPVNAIGGLNKDNIDVLKGIPIAGICVVSAIMKADDPKHAAIELQARAKELGLC